MTYRRIKWVIFITLFLIAPAILFLIQAVLLMPAVFIIAGILFIIFKTISNLDHIGENLSFITILGIHLLFYSGIYYLISYILAKFISLINSDNARKVFVLVLCLSVSGMSLLPLYGGGGHGPVELVNLPEYLKDINRSYGSATSALVYGIVLLFLILKSLINYISSGERMNPK